MRIHNIIMYVIVGQPSPVCVYGVKTNYNSRLLIMQFQLAATMYEKYSEIRNKINSKTKLANTNKVVGPSHISLLRILYILI